MRKATGLRVSASEVEMSPRTYRRSYIIGLVRVCTGKGVKLLTTRSRRCRPGRIGWLSAS